MNYFFVIQIEDEFEDDEVVEEDKLEEVGDEECLWFFLVCVLFFQ